MFLDKADAVQDQTCGARPEKKSPGTEKFLPAIFSDLRPVAASLQDHGARKAVHWRQRAVGLEMETHVHVNGISNSETLCVLFGCARSGRSATLTAV